MIKGCLCAALIVRFWVAIPRYSSLNVSSDVVCQDQNTPLTNESSYGFLALRCWLLQMEPVEDLVVMLTQALE